MINTRSLLAVAAAVLLPLASCSSPTDDRSGPNGAQPDGYQDMTHVIVYRAPDLVPNLAVGCVGQYGFIVSLKTTAVNGIALARFTDYDRVCKAS